MTTWLLKTEPDGYPFDALVRDGRTVWDGVANAAACIHLRAMRPGDDVLVYHTGSERRIAGLARVVSEPYADPTAPGLNGKGEIARPVIDLVPVQPATRAVTLADIKDDPTFPMEGFELVRLPRLSVMPVPPAADARLRVLAGL